MITIPLSVDIEAGYSADLNQIIKHIIQLADLGVAGINNAFARSKILT
ncbi:hypothetical protein [Pseudoalteromonas sp. DL2-H6]